MKKGFIYRILRGKKGITGLETAIILIAFVVVASVFAYTVLSAGIFSSQKGQEAIHSGLDSTQATLELKGAVTATADPVGAAGVGYVGTVVFTLQNALPGVAIDITLPTDLDTDGIADDDSTNVMVISYVDKGVRVDNLAWTLAMVGDDDGDNMLETGEKVEITVTFTGTTGLDAYLTANTTFSILVVPPVGAVIELQRTTPAYIDTEMNLG